jgi:hypothetical protein
MLLEHTHQTGHFSRREDVDPRLVARLRANAAVRADDHDRYGANILAKVQADNQRHLEEEDGAWRWSVADGSDDFLRRCRRDDVEPVCFEQALERIANLLVGVDYEDRVAMSHAPNCSATERGR